MLDNVLLNTLSYNELSVLFSARCYGSVMLGRYVYYQDDIHIITSFYIMNGVRYIKSFDLEIRLEDVSKRTPSIETVEKFMRETPSVKPMNYLDVYNELRAARKCH